MGFYREDEELEGVGLWLCNLPNLLKDRDRLPRLLTVCACLCGHIIMCMQVCVHVQLHTIITLSLVSILDESFLTLLQQ